MDSPERAVILGQFLVSSTKRLADFPEMGRVVPEFGDPSLREIVVRSYRVITASITAIARLKPLFFGCGRQRDLEIAAGGREPDSNEE